MQINSGAWPFPFAERPWNEIAVNFAAMAVAHPQFQHMVDVVDSVIANHGQTRLAGLTSMHDLVVTPRPLPDQPPIEVVIVRSPSSGRVGDGAVLIEHRSITGHDDKITRPAAEAVPLFWRFMIEKFGIEPTRIPPSDGP